MRETLAKPEPTLKPLLDRLARTWGEVARDVVLIVCSILIAFALDAWWDGWGERRAQHEQIATLRSELLTARTTLEAMAEAVQGAADATHELLLLMGPEASGSDPERLFDLLGRSLNFGGSSPSQRALESVLATGNPWIESSESLADLLGDWPGLMEELEADIAHLERNRDADLHNALISIGIPGIAGTPSVSHLGLPPAPFPLETERLVRSVGVYAALSYRALRFQVLSMIVDDALERADSILAELDRLGARGET